MFSILGFFFVVMAINLITWIFSIAVNKYYLGSKIWNYIEQPFKLHYVMNLEIDPNHCFLGWYFNELENYSYISVLMGINLRVYWDEELHIRKNRHGYKEPCYIAGWTRYGLSMEGKAKIEKDEHGEVLKDVSFTSSSLVPEGREEEIIFLSDKARLKIYRSDKKLTIIPPTKIKAGWDWGLINDLDVCSISLKNEKGVELIHNGNFDSDTNWLRGINHKLTDKDLAIIKKNIDGLGYMGTNYTAKIFCVFKLTGEVQGFLYTVYDVNSKTYSTCKDWHSALQVERDTVFYRLLLEWFEKKDLKYEEYEISFGENPEIRLAEKSSK